MPGSAAASVWTAKELSPTKMISRPGNQRQICKTPCLPSLSAFVSAAPPLVVALGRAQDRQHRQGLDASGPWHRGQNHEAQPSQSHGLNEVAMAGAHRVPINPPSGDALAPTAFDCIVHSDHDGPIGHEPFNDDGQQARRQKAGGPAGTVEELMIGGNIADLCSTGDPQACRHCSLAWRKDRTHHQDQKMVPARRGKQARNGDSHWRRMWGTASPRSLRRSGDLLIHRLVSDRAGEARNADCGELIHPGPLSKGRNPDRFRTKSS